MSATTEQFLRHPKAVVGLPGSVINFSNKFSRELLSNDRPTQGGNTLPAGFTIT
jgi:hypothetical protein